MWFLSSVWKIISEYLLVNIKTESLVFVNLTRTIKFPIEALSLVILPDNLHTSYNQKYAGLIVTSEKHTRISINMDLVNNIRIILLKAICDQVKFHKLQKSV